MYTKPISFLLAFLVSIICYFPSTHAQVEDLRGDSAFFHDQMEVYQRWLDHSGLGNILSVKDVGVEEQRLSLYLGFTFGDIDSIMVAWSGLKAAFEADHTITLEQQLFYKAATLLEVRQSILDVQLYDTYDLRKEPLFFRGIYFADGEVKVEESNPRAKIREIEIDRKDLQRRGVTSDLKLSFDPQGVFDLILGHADRKYRNQNCPDRQAKVTLLERSKKTLRFEAVNLCLEVLEDEGRVCPIMRKLGIQCNWAKRELLTFTISYTETTEGFQLNIVLDGKYGSGLYENVRRGGYMSMEIDFDEELDRYADQFKEEIRRVILGP